MALEGGEGSMSHPWPLFTPRKYPVPIVQEAEWAPGPVWTGAQNIAPTGIRSPDCPTHRQSLYQLSYTACVAVVAHQQTYMGLLCKGTCGR